MQLYTIIQLFTIIYNNIQVYTIMIVCKGQDYNSCYQMLYIEYQKLIC